MFSLFERENYFLFSLPSTFFIHPFLLTHLLFDVMMFSVYKYDTKWSPISTR